jgi:hypothetical protein
MFSYDIAALNLPLNQVRLLLGDTNRNDPLLQDEEVQFGMSQGGGVNLYAMAAASARLIAAKLAKEVDAVNEPLRQIFSQRMNRFLKLAEMWEENLEVDPAGAAALSAWSAPLAGGDVQPASPAFYRGVASDPANDAAVEAGYWPNTGVPYPNG